MNKEVNKVGINRSSVFGGASLDEQIIFYYQILDPAD